MTPPLPDELAVTATVARALDRLGVPYVVGGSLASSLHGRPRSTHDVDLVAALRHAHVLALLEALADAFYVSDEAVRAAVSNRRSFNLIHLATMVKVDIFVVADDRSSRGQLARGVEVDLGGDAGPLVRFASPEDTVVRKLDWFRRTGGTSERQWSDVLGVIQVQGARLDRALLRTLAEELDVGALLMRALREGDAGA